MIKENHNFDNKELFDLTASEAEALLSAFLETELKFFSSFSVPGIDLNNSRESVIKLFEFAVREVISGSTDEYHFDNVWSLRMGFYFGESLRKSSEKLKWGIGSKNYAEENHPVILGFKNKLEAPMISISRNVISAIAFDGENFNRAAKAVNTWFEFAK